MVSGHHHRTVLRSRRSSEGSQNKETIRVISPETLAEGYVFDVSLGGKIVSVTVPPGGVQKGEAFEFTLPQDIQSIDNAANPMEVTDKTNASDGPTDLSAKPTSSSDEESQYDSIGAPTGRWRTHLCACCDVITQGTFWMSFCCAPVLIAQLLTRLGLDWKGTRASPEEASLAFNRIVVAFIAVLIFGNFPAIGFMSSFLFTMGLMLWTGRNLRRTMRRRYNIPPTLPERIDDFCCMLWCSCCSTIQMARHTHDDKEYPGACCTTTGLELDAPVIV